MKQKLLDRVQEVLQGLTWYIPEIQTQVSKFAKFQSILQPMSFTDDREGEISGEQVLKPPYKYHEL